MHTIVRSALHELPQPLHLFAASFTGHHYHFGLFDDPRRSLDDAQEALAHEIARRVPRRARTLDVGCGLGGTARLLARQGRVTVGIDPCNAAIAFASASHHGFARAQFAVDTFEQYASQRASPAFGALVLVEVLQYLPPLEQVLRRALELLEPSGTLVIADVVKTTTLPWERVPFHPIGALEACAREAGFACLERVDLTRQVLPTPTHVVRELRESRERLLALFPDRRALDDEIDELARQCALLDETLRNGDLGYELVVLRRPAHA